MCRINQSEDTCFGRISQHLSKDYSVTCIGGNTAMNFDARRAALIVDGRLRSCAYRIEQRP
jgi:hypothetical protein